MAPCIDYRLGWRWLLPLGDNGSVFLTGFTECEAEFWKGALTDIAITDVAATATVWLVQDLPLSRVSHLDPAHLQTIGIIGSRAMLATWRQWLAGRFVEVRDYVLLPPDAPRVVVPLGVPDWTVQALALHRPGRVLARLAVSLLKALARVGFDLPLRSRQLCIASTIANALPQGARRAGLALNGDTAPKAFALYLGTPDDNRKTVILPLGGAGRTILKAGGFPKAQAALCNEAAALKVMSLTSLASQVPALLDMVECGNQVTLCQEYRARSRMGKAGLKRAVVTFLSELSCLGRYERPLAEVLEQANLPTSREARAMGRESYAAVRDRLDAPAAAGVTVWGHRSHGDFAPWNCAWTAQGFFVFDWEESRAWAPAWGDAFYYTVAPAVLIARSPRPRAVEADAWALAQAVIREAGLPIGDIHIYWALWLLQRMNRQYAPFYERLLERLAATWH